MSDNRKYYFITYALTDYSRWPDARFENVTIDQDPIVWLLQERKEKSVYKDAKILFVREVTKEQFEILEDQDD